MTRLLAHTIASAALLVVSGCGMDGYDHAGELDALAGGKADGPSAPRKAWTFVLYGAADNSLADSIRHDVNELESVGSTADINFLAFLDRPEGARTYYLLEDRDPVALPSPSVAWGQVDSGDASTLIDVADWAVDRFPADHVVLVVSGHGGGTPRVIAPDDSTGHAISAPALEDAIHRITATSGPLELFGADACLMQSVELAYQLRDETAFVVGSANTEPGNGWDYQFVGRNLVSEVAGDTASGSLLADLLVGGYARSYGGTSSNVSLSALDTAALDTTRVDEMKDLARAIAAHARTATGKAELQAISGSVRRIDVGGGPDTFVDAPDLAQQLQTTSSDALRRAARQFELLLQTPDSLYAGKPSLVHVAWGFGSSGASIYFPVGADSVDAYAAGSQLATDVGWADAIRAIW